MTKRIAGDCDQQLSQLEVFLEHLPYAPRPSSGYDPGTGRAQFHLNDAVVLSLELVYCLGTRLAIKNYWKCHEI